MKLITHNMLTSKFIKGVEAGYPLEVKDATDIKTLDVEFNRQFIARVIPKLNWDALYNTAKDIGHLEDLPKAIVQDYENDEEFLKKAHHILLEIDIMNGFLVCPETHRKFPINNGIPNMLLNENEV